MAVAIGPIPMMPLDVMPTDRHLLPFQRIHLPSGDELELRTRVNGILSAMYPHGHGSGIERRQEIRYPYPHLVYLSPVGADGVSATGESIVVTGKHLTEHGLTIYHPEPLSHRRMIASLEAGRGRWLGVLVDLSWCRFTDRGWYESGGRFLQLVQSPMRQAS